MKFIRNLSYTDLNSRIKKDGFDEVEVRTIGILQK